MTTWPHTNDKIPQAECWWKKTGKSLLSLDLNNTDNRLKHDQENLKEAETRTEERDLMDMYSFYCTATRYLTRHLPSANELFYDLAVLHPLMLKEDYACQVIC